MFGDLNYLSASFLPVVLTVQVITFITFIGGFLATLWYACNGLAAAGRLESDLEGEGLERRCSSSRPRRSCGSAFVYHLIGFATNY